MNELIKDLSGQLVLLKRAGSISEQVYGVLYPQLSALHKKYIELHGRAALHLEKYQGRDSQLPQLAKAASICLTLRTALPADGNVETQEAETSLVATIDEIARQLKDAMTIEPLKP